MPITPYLITNVTSSTYSTIFPTQMASNRFMFTPLNTEPHFRSPHNNVFFSCESISVPILYKSPACINLRDEVLIERLPISMAYAINKKQGKVISVNYSKPNFSGEINPQRSIDEWCTKLKYEILINSFDEHYYHCIEKYGFMWFFSSFDPINDADIDIIKSTVHGQDYYMCVSYNTDSSIYGRVVSNTFYNDSTIHSKIVDAIELVRAIYDMNIKMDSGMTYMDLISQSSNHNGTNFPIKFNRRVAINESFMIEIRSTNINLDNATNILKKMDTYLPVTKMIIDVLGSDEKEIMIRIDDELMESSEQDKCIEHITRCLNLLKLNGGNVAYVYITFSSGIV